MPEHADRFLQLVQGRSDAEVTHVLAVVEAATRAMDAALVAEYGRLIAHATDRRAALVGVPEPRRRAMSEDRTEAQVKADHRHRMEADRAEQAARAKADAARKGGK